MLDDITNEERLYMAYQGFDTSVRYYEDLLNDWVATTPDRYEPYLAIATYYIQLDINIPGKRSYLSL